jgi:orotidine-5'-phosphate decarboxylase
VELPSSVQPGELVPIRLRVANAARRPLQLSLRGRTPVFDIVVSRADGSPAWRRLEGQMVPAILQILVLAPGDSLDLQTEWDQRTNRGEPVEAGSYIVRGRLVTGAREPLETAGVPLRILPR